MSDSIAMNERLAFIRLDGDTRKVLASVQPIIEKSLDSSLSSF